MIAERLTAQLLAGEPASDPGAVAERLLAIQAQDPRGARLAIRARTSGLSAGDVDRALDARELLITWLNRGTLHLVRSEDYHWLHALTAPTIRTANARRLTQEGLPPTAAARGARTIERALAAEGPLTRQQLRERLEAAGVRTEGQALVHLLVLASLQGHVVRGPMLDGHHAFVHAHDWLGTPPRAVERDEALAEFARRYLRGHAPAEERDLAKWAGLPLRDVRAGLRAIASQLARRADGMLQLIKHPPAAPMPPPRLLGAFDPLLLGWRSREDILGAHRSIVTVNGLFRPFALVRGRAVATWSMPGGEVVLEPLTCLSRRDAAALTAEAKDVVRYLADAQGDHPGDDLSRPAR